MIDNAPEGKFFAEGSEDADDEDQGQGRGGKKFLRKLRDDIGRKEL